jgi:peroxiredoxin
MEEKKSRKKGIVTLVLIFALLFTYVYLSSYSRTGSCSGGPGSGETAPAFALEKLEGGKVSMEDYKGKVLVLNFWVTWCRPCKKELPTLMSLYKKFKDKEDFAMLAISCDEEGKKAVEKLFASRNVELPVALDPNREVGFLKYGVSKFPETFFIDKKGNIRYKFAGPRNWTDRKFIDILNQMLAE